MQLNDILQRLKGVKGSGNQYQALCPAHDDKEPSLSVSESEGKILLHCHAGCSVESIVTEMGLGMKDLYTTDKSDKSGGYTSSPSKQRGAIAAIYDYKDLNGNTIHSTIRYTPKGFSQRRPDPNSPGGYILKDVFKGITPILYNLQAVTQAVNDKTPILIVEGEKDCDTLAEIGFTATTCPLGAGKWRNHYSDILKGGIVYIVADNDEAGVSHAKSVAKSLDGKAEGIYMIDITSVAPKSMTEIPGGWDVTDLLNSTPQEKHIAVVAELIANSTKYGGSDEGLHGGCSGKIGPAEMLLNLVEATEAGFFHSEIKELYATIPVRSHVEVLPLSGRDFEIWLNSLFYKGYGKPISKEAIKQVIGVLSAKALFDNPTPVKLSVRVAEHDGAFWYDLTNEDWQVVKITKDGWSVVDNPPILFERYRHQTQQALPQSGGNISKILDYVNIRENKTLFLCWLVSCFVPDIPHTIVIIHGEKCSAKSTASAMSKSLIDPSALDTLTLTNDQRSLVVSLQQHWYLPFDNVSYISEDVSDMLCRASTGGAMQQRKLNTNAEDTLFIFRKCIAFNGIHNVATCADLLDRSILIELMRIKDNNRRELSEIMAKFEADKPCILGGIFDILVKAISLYPTVSLRSFPRMADFARWGYAIGEALGEGLGQVFLDEFSGNRQIQNEEAIASDPVATLIVELMQEKASWYGRYSDLYKKLVDMADDYGVNVKHKSFPPDATRLSKRITAIKSNLESAGVFCERQERHSKHGQYLSINRPILDTLASLATQSAVHAGLSDAANGVANNATKNGEVIASPVDTPESIIPKAIDIKGYERNGAANVANVAKKPLLTEQCEDLFSGWEPVGDADIPSEWLTPPPLQKQPPEQLRLPLSQ